METANKQTHDDGVMKTVYKTHGTCSQYIEVDVKDGKVTNCQFYGGCDGNTKGISQLVRGMSVEEVKNKLDGIRCGTKGTSCPDQLCRALEQLLRENA